MLIGHLRDRARRENENHSHFDLTKKERRETAEFTLWIYREFPELDGR